MSGLKHKPFSRKAPRAEFVPADSPELTLIVDMDRYYIWLSQHLTHEVIDKIKKVESQEDFESFMLDMKIKFIFPDDADEQIDLPGLSFRSSPY